MPEGDNIREHAERLSRLLCGTPLEQAYSPVVHLEPLISHRVTAVRSHGKQLLIEFDNQQVLRTHLRMDGKIRIDQLASSELPWSPRVRWLLSTARGRARCIDAPTVELIERARIRSHPVLSRLGPDLLAEQLDETEVVRRLLEPPILPIGAALMDQDRLAGIGNVYKSEVLFMTGTSPFVRTDALDQERLLSIVRTARIWMRRNVGQPRRTTPQGRLHARHWVYGRSGEPCLRCGNRVRMRRQEPMSRSTYYCPECQAVEGER